jgi:ubiquinone/menaquinone biosynthesis C-methylase UbiE
MDNWQLTLLIALFLMFLNYLMLKFLITTHIPTEVDEKEAFTNHEGFSGGTAVDGAIEEFTNETLYDNFYSKIYDQIVQGEVRVRTEVIFTLGWIKKYRPDLATVKILDVGCGTGAHVAEFVKEGVGEVTGIDQSSAMIKRANKLHPDHNFKVANAEQPLTFAAGQFNVATLYYFTMYYIHHKDQVLRNLFTWLSPGGGLVIHVVNRDKFDPILESASPFMAFSVQKYTKERVTKSKVAFDKFEYSAEFTSDEADAEFEETFKFKDGRVRKNKHSLHMPVMESLVHEIEQAGFTYKEFIDLTPIGYEYQYLFCFIR